MAEPRPRKVWANLPLDQGPAHRRLQVCTYSATRTSDTHSGGTSPVSEYRLSTRAARLAWSPCRPGPASRSPRRCGTAADCSPAARPAAPTFAEYIPVVSALVSDGCRRAYGSYWNQVTGQWGSRRIDEPTPSQIRQ